MSEQCCEVSLVEKLRSVDIGYRICVTIQWSESGVETGHRFIPVGYMMHEAANAIIELEQKLAAAVTELEKLRNELKNAQPIGYTTSFYIEMYDKYRQTVITPTPVEDWNVPLYLHPPIQEGKVLVPKDLHNELLGVIADVDMGYGFDDVCLETIKRVHKAMLLASQTKGD